MINPFKQSGISQSCHLDQSISISIVVRRYFSFFNQILMDLLLVNSGDPDQMPHFKASNLGVHCYVSHIIDNRWVNTI